MAALLLVGPCAALSHVSAARRLGLDVPPRFGVQLTIPHDVRAPPLAGVEIFRSRDFDFSSITLRQGFRVTRLGRTMLDLSSGLERDWLRASLRSAMRQQRANLDLCWRSLNAQGHGHHGAKTLRELLWETEEDGEFSDSALEALTMELGLATGRRPLLHHRVQTQALTAEIDFAWPERKLAVEVDGWKYHATKDAFETDRERDVALFFSGWSVLRFTWRRVTAERDGVIHQLMAALDRAPVLTAG